MDCNNINNRLIKYVTGSVSDSDRFLLKKHISECSACSDEYTKLLRVWETLSEIPESPPPSDMTCKVLDRIEEYERSSFFNIILSRLRGFNLNLAVASIAALFAGLVIGTVFESYTVQYPGSSGLERDIYAEFFYDISPFSLAGGYSELIEETKGE